MQRIIVTSMSKKYWNMSGLTWLNSLMLHNPCVTPYIVSEDMAETAYIHPIECVSYYEEFITQAAEKERGVDNTNYRWQARRFCHKPFAIEQAFNNFDDCNIYWFDADVEFTGPIDFDAIDPPIGGVSCLQRSAWGHTEGGYIGFDQYAHELINLWNSFYRSGKLFDLKEWHDMLAFDVSVGLLNVNVRNLAEGINLKHVWPHTVLAKFSQHHKGPGRKQDAFGVAETCGAVLQTQDDVKE